MSRLASLVVPGLSHCVTQRGSERARVFSIEADYALYRDLLGQFCRAASVSVQAGGPVAAEPKVHFSRLAAHDPALSSPTASQYTKIPATRGFVMPDLSTLALFAIACLALTATPGPDMLLIASRSVSQGRTAGFASLGGIQAGTYCHALAAALGLSQLFLVVPLAYDVVRYAGAAYLLYLAWQAFRSSAEVPSCHVATVHYPTIVMFRQGLLTNLLNPKMALFVLALFPQFVRPENGSVAGQIMILATVLNLIGLGVNGLIIIMASRIRLAFSGKSRFRKASQMLLGTVFAGLAARLAFDGQR